jgi:hypothetical protein
MLDEVVDFYQRQLITEKCSCCISHAVLNYSANSIHRMCSHLMRPQWRQWLLLCRVRLLFPPSWRKVTDAVHKGGGIFLAAVAHGVLVALLLPAQRAAAGAPLGNQD